MLQLWGSGWLWGEVWGAPGDGMPWAGVWCGDGCAGSRAALTGCATEPGAALDLARALKQMEGGRCSSQAAWKAWKIGRRWEKKP